MAKGENSASMKGEVKAKKQAGSETVKHLESVGSHMGGGVKFGMPKGVPDHSKVRGTVGKE
jgi:hypothetical protein